MYSGQSAASICSSKEKKGEKKMFHPPSGTTARSKRYDYESRGLSANGERFYLARIVAGHLSKSFSPRWRRASRIVPFAWITFNGRLINNSKENASRVSSRIHLAIIVHRIDRGVANNDTFVEISPIRMQSVIWESSWPKDVSTQPKIKTFTLLVAKLNLTI